MKVYIQVVDTRSYIYQCGMIDEPVQGFNNCISNALIHFGINPNDIELEQNDNKHYYGKVKETTKVVSIITV